MGAASEWEAAFFMDPVRVRFYELTWDGRENRSLSAGNAEPPDMNETVKAPSLILPLAYFRAFLRREAILASFLFELYLRLHKARLILL